MTDLTPFLRTFFSGNDKSRINSPGDTIEFINPALLGDAAVLVLDLLASLENLQCRCW